MSLIDIRCYEKDAFTAVSVNNWDRSKCVLDSTKEEFDVRTITLSFMLRSHISLKNYQCCRLIYTKNG